MTKKLKLTKKQKAHRKFIASEKWRSIKITLYKARGRKCEKCGRTKSLQVHHLTYVRFGGDELPEDLQILCGYHHRLEHGLIKKKRYKIKNGVKKRSAKQKKKKRFKNLSTPNEIYLLAVIICWMVLGHNHHYEFRKGKMG